MANASSADAFRRARIRTILWRTLAESACVDRRDRYKLVRQAVQDIVLSAPNPWLDEKQAAARYPLTRDFLRRARSKGQGPPFYRIRGRASVGSRVVYHVADLDAFIAERRVAGKTFQPGADPAEQDAARQETDGWTGEP